jgi:hypothetical protein
LLFAEKTFGGEYSPDRIPGPRTPDPGSRIPDPAPRIPIPIPDSYLTSSPIGHDTPVPPIPQYPAGFFDKYC